MSARLAGKPWLLEDGSRLRDGVPLEETLGAFCCYPQALRRALLPSAQTSGICVSSVAARRATANASAMASKAD